jgi:hypothetical protein
VELPLGRTTLTAENGEYSGESAMGGGHNTTTSENGSRRFLWHVFGAYIKPSFRFESGKATEGTTQRGLETGHRFSCGYAHPGYREVGI